MRWRRAIGWFRDGWIILGITLVVFIALESVYRTVAMAGSALRQSSPQEVVEPDHPYAGQPWWRGRTDWERQLGAIPRRHDPFRTWVWGRSHDSPSINIDSSGNRLTVPGPESPDRPRVFMLGGSTMWGYTARDSFTIPSLVARRLRSAGLDVDVINLAQPAYTFTQEVITLLLRLRAGDVPRAVVFLNGHNDIAAAWENGHAGAAGNEEQLAAKFEPRDLGSWTNIGTYLAGHSRLVTRLQQMAPARVKRRPSIPASLCSDIAAQYRNLEMQAEALGRAFAFPTSVFFQPLLATSAKPRTPWERSIPPAEYHDYLIRCSAVIDSSMRYRVGRTYFPLHTLFEKDSTSVFLDEQGHVTERANSRIADQVATILIPLLREHVR